MNLNPEPKYLLRYDANGNVLFLDYGGGEYSNYEYRWYWTRQNHTSKTDDWFLCCFHQHHPNALSMLPKEIELAQRAYAEIIGGAAGIISAPDEKTHRRHVL